MNRIKQLIWAITSRYKSIDTKFLEKYLNKEELNAFNKLNNVEKHHCIRVCEDSIDYINKNKGQAIDVSKMAKIALMHDIGKIDKSLNVLQKCIVVILDKISSGKTRRFTNFKIFDVYYNHPEKSCNILNSIGSYDDEFLEAIVKHHSKETYKNIYLQILKEMDDRN